jgi:hypothetical protein
LNEEIHVIKELQPSLTPQVEAAVRDFMRESDLNGVNEEGFYYQTLESIAAATYLGGGGEFWVATKDGELLIYILASVGKDFDNRLTYHVNQAWVRKDYRGRPIVKAWWEAIRERARSLMCGHLAITSSRGVKAYERFLGHGMKYYASILKESL